MRMKKVFHLVKYDGCAHVRDETLSQQHSDDSDQPGHLTSLIRALAVAHGEGLGLKLPRGGPRISGKGGSYV